VKIQENFSSVPGIPSAPGVLAVFSLLLLASLAACAGNQSRAAQLLGIPRRTFVSKLDTYQIPRPKKDPTKN